METIVNNKQYHQLLHKMISNEVEDLVKGVEPTINAINEKLFNTDWIISSNIKYNEKSLRAHITDLTLNQRKKLKNKINTCFYKPTLKSINTFLHFMHKNVFMETTPAPSARVSDKEAKIQITRKQYVAARNITIQLYKEYKEEKGDYYKKRLVK
jgi:hypothetical protein